MTLPSYPRALQADRQRRGDARWTRKGGPAVLVSHLAGPVTSCCWRTRGRELVALDPAGEPLAPEEFPAAAVFAFGAERDGLSDELLAHAQRRVALPMSPGVSSLNFATAVVATLYALKLTRR